MTALRDAAPSAELSPKAENTEASRERENHGRAAPEPAKAPLFSAGKLKQLFGKMAEVLTGKPTPSLTARRKRRGETEGAFNLAAVKVAVRVLQSILDFLYEPQPPIDRKAAAERFARFKRGPANDTGQHRPRRADHYRPRKIDPKRGPC
jgi:hypothetical protein